MNANPRPVTPLLLTAATAYLLCVGLALAGRHLASAAPSPTPQAPPKPTLKAPDAKDITGLYEVVGKDSKDEYTGIVTIRRVHDAYVVQWLTGDLVTGIGHRSGEHFAVGWVIDKPGKLVRGVTLYRISEGRMDGRWLSMPGNGQPGSETLHFVKALKE